MVIEDKSIGKKLKELRENILRVSQRQLAEELDTTQGNISQIEKGLCTPAGNYLRKLGERFPDINYNWLFFDDGQPMRRDTKKKIVTEVKTKIKETELKNKYNALAIEVQKLRDYNTNMIKLINKKIDPSVAAPKRKTTKDKK